MKYTKTMRRISTGLLAVISGFIFTGAGLAQGNRAVVLMRSGNTTAAVCDGAADMNYQMISDFKLNAAGEIRLLNFAGGAGTSPDAIDVSRKDYEDAAKVKLGSLYQIKWQDNFLVAAGGGGGQTAFLVLPEDMKPQKNMNSRVNSFYGILLTGESRDSKQKKKVSLALNDIWKIYFASEGKNINDILFAHAAEEKSVVIWEAFLKKTSNYRAGEANDNMRDVLVTCARASLDQFINGDYKALETARERTERAQTVKSDANTDKLLIEINQQKQRVNTAREQLAQLVGSSRWDEAITAAEPIKIYLSTWAELNTMYTDALQRSHELHLTKGKKALEANQLDVALTECTTAWQRVTSSADARGCVCTSRNKVALRDSNNFRQRKQPKLAVEKTESQLADSDCPRDEAVAKELEVAKREYAQQLLAEAKQLTGGAAAGGGGVKPTTVGKGTGKNTPPKVSTVKVGALKAVSAQNKQNFRDAREKLLLAEGMSPAEDARALLDKVNQSLAGYCVAEARKALQRGDFGTAYVYLMSAQNYTPESSDVNVLLEQARSQLEEKTRVSIGVVFDNKAGYGDTELILNEVSSEIESIATRVGLAQPVILDRGQAATALRAMQGGTNLPSPTAIFSGDLLGAKPVINSTNQRVRSYYEEPNPEWKRRDYIHDAKDKEYDNCKKQLGKQGCTSVKSEVDQLERWRDSVDRQLKHYYYYNARLFRVAGNAKLTFRYADSISRAVRAADTLTAGVADECVELSGVDSRDNSARNTECSRVQESFYIEKLSAQLRSDASRRAYTLLAELPMSYYKRAKSAANRQQSVEDYLRFLFLTSAKNGAEAEDAKKFLLAFDAELTTDGVLR